MLNLNLFSLRNPRLKRRRYLKIQ